MQGVRLEAHFGAMGQLECGCSLQMGRKVLCFYNGGRLGMSSQVACYLSLWYQATLDNYPSVQFKS